MMPLAIMRFTRALVIARVLTTNSSRGHFLFRRASLFIFRSVSLIYFFAGEAVEKTVSSCFNSGTDSWFYNGSLEVGQDSFYSSYGVGCPEKANLFKMSRASSRGIALRECREEGLYRGSQAIR